MTHLNLKEAYKKVSQSDSFCFIQMLDGTLFPVEEVLTSSVVPNGDIDVVPGSFNPLHVGHEAIYNAVLNSHRFYELALRRVNKWTLSLEEMDKCLKQFISKAPVIVMNPPLLMQKAGVLYKWNVKFHIGFDTAARLLEKSSPIEVQGIRAKFEVYDRKIVDKVYTTQDLPQPLPLNFSRGKSLPEAVTGLSSTQLRTIEQIRAPEEVKRNDDYRAN